MITRRKKEIREAIDAAKASLDKAVKFLNDNGVEYRPDEWLTVKRYCERFGIKDTHVVSNWIRRGIIPPENIQVMEELNGLKLIKAVPYKG